jgi:FAD/FMN-containing dehydrogenase
MDDGLDTVSRSAAQAHTPAWVAELQSITGCEVTLDESTRQFYAQDVFAEGAPLAAVVTPTSVNALQAAMKILAEARVPIVSRGGGLSYTDGYLATQENSALIDMAKLSRVVELNLEDRYVTVETGLCWGTLDELLAKHGLRTPYWGPLSGLRSTVGGALSQCSVFLGSGNHGSVGDTVLSIDVVLADGSLLSTGSAAAGNAKPFIRYFGPDLTGLFVGDAGALGIKVLATLKLIPREQAIDFVSAEFDDPIAMLNAMSEISRQNLASECFAFDPVLLEQRKKRMSLMSDAKTLLNVVKQSGLIAGLGLVKSGRDFVGENKYSAHVALEGQTAAEVAAKVEAAKRIFMANQGTATENSFPKALRAMPFTPPNSMLGPAGERWVPVHGIFPHSNAASAFRALQDFFKSKSTELDANQIRVGYLITTIAQQATLLEPVFYWPDSHTAYHKQMVEADYLKKCGEPSANPNTRALVQALKAETAILMRGLGGTHFQLGKFYTYREGRNPAALALFDAVKKQLDPNGLMNPGVLK